PRLPDRRPEGGRAPVRERETRMHGSPQAPGRRASGRENHGRAEGGGSAPIVQMAELRTETEIDGPVERVWQVLTDFKSFPDWNPFIRSIRGKAVEGSRLDVLLGASGTRPMRF